MEIFIEWKLILSCGLCQNSKCLIVANPGFPRRGGGDLLFGKIFAENFMKMKEIEPSKHS